jgi:hypothetical protein
MANTYTWDQTPSVDVYLTHDSHSDVVYIIYWRLNATSDQNDPEGNPYVASTYGTQSISTDDIQNFIPFADLTGAIVQGWTETAMGEDQVQAMKDGLDSTIDGLINPTSETKIIGS